MANETYIPIVDEDDDPSSYYNTKRLDNITKNDSDQRSDAIGNSNQGKKKKVQRKGFDEGQKLTEKMSAVLAMYVQRTLTAPDGPSYHPGEAM